MRLVTASTISAMQNAAPFVVVFPRQMSNELDLTVLFQGVPSGGQVEMTVNGVAFVGDVSDNTLTWTEGGGGAGGGASASVAAGSGGKVWKGILQRKKLNGGNEVGFRRETWWVSPDETAIATTST